MFTIHDIIALAVRLEENGQRVYQKAAKAADDPQIREMLEPFISDKKTSETLGCIIYEENTHIEKLKGIFPKITRAAR